MIVEELIDKLKEFPDDAEVYLEVDDTSSVCRGIVNDLDMDYCIFLTNNEVNEYDIGFDDNLNLIRVIKG